MYATDTDVPETDFPDLYVLDLIFFARLLHQAALWDNADLLEDLLNGEELEYVPQSYLKFTQFLPKYFSSMWLFSGISTHATHGVEVQFTLQPQPSPRCVFEFLSRFSHYFLSSDSDTNYAND